MKRAILLVGPKGAGKSTLGNLLEKALGVRFVRVEPLFLEVRASLGASHPDFERRGFEAVLARLERELATAETICFESTGVSPHFPWFLTELGRLATILPIRVHADPSQCLDRIARRDLSIHIPVSDHDVARINAIAFGVELPWAAEIDNSGPLDAARLVEQVRTLLSDSETRG